MQIEVRGRNVEVTDELRGHVLKRFRRVGMQVSELAILDVEISEERNPSIADSQVAEATLALKGVTLRAREATPEMAHTIHELAEDIRRQVKRHRELRRKRSRTRRAVGRIRRSLPEPRPPLTLTDACCKGHGDARATRWGGAQIQDL